MSLSFTSTLLTSGKPRWKSKANILRSFVLSVQRGEIALSQRSLFGWFLVLILFSLTNPQSPVKELEKTSNQVLARELHFPFLKVFWNMPPQTGTDLVTLYCSFYVYLLCVGNGDFLGFYDAYGFVNLLNTLAVGGKDTLWSMNTQFKGLVQSHWFFFQQWMVSRRTESRKEMDTFKCHHIHQLFLVRLEDALCSGKKA